MTKAEKAASGLLYDANYDEELLRKRDEARLKLYTFNHTPVANKVVRDEILHSLFGRHGKNIILEGPFYCDYGYNIEIGENFYANVNLTILDGARVTIGDNVFIAPNVGIYTAGHPLDAGRRNKGLEYAYPVTIGNNVWIGAGVTILPGVTIGSDSVIGAGAVVLRDVPERVLVAGNPARIVREITDEDQLRYT